MPKNNIFLKIKLEAGRNNLFNLMPKVRLFTTPSCPYCFVLKEFLKEKGIEFEEVDVLKDEKARDEMIKKSGQLAVPVVEIDGKIIVGFDKEKISRILKIKS